MQPPALHAQLLDHHSSCAQAQVQLDSEILYISVVHLFLSILVFDRMCKAAAGIPVELDRYLDGNLQSF
jgi:hypothetical protein